MSYLLIFFVGKMKSEEVEVLLLFVQKYRRLTQRIVKKLTPSVQSRVRHG